MNKRIFEPLSNFDLDDFFREIQNKKCNIQMYKDIKKNNSLKDLFKNNNYCIIYLESPDKNVNVGHWVMVFYSDNEANFFDSYGSSINYLCPSLVPLLFQHFKKINSNKIKYQEIGDRSSTCGRHCLFTLGLLNLIKNFNFDDLKEIMDELKKKYKLKNYNQVVSKYVNIDL